MGFAKVILPSAILLCVAGCVKERDRRSDYLRLLGAEDLLAELGLLARLGCT